MIFYDIENWYWVVAGDESRVWSSATRAWFDADDPAYLAWLEAGGVPTRIASRAELCGVVNAPLIERIEALERKQARPLRDIALGLTPPEGEPTPQARLQEIEQEIETLRAQMLY